MFLDVSCRRVVPRGEGFERVVVAFVLVLEQNAREFLPGNLSHLQASFEKVVTFNRL
jgi:hypothetical protein